MSFGNKIKDLRTKVGMTQKELAEKLHVSFQTVSRWEKDENEPDISTLKSISKIFNIDMNELLSGDSEDDETEEEEVRSEYRTPFDSKFTIDSDSLANYERGYGESFGKVISKSEITITENNEKRIKEYGFDTNISIQGDVGIYFSVNNTEKFFALIFSGAIQFLCPFENYIGINISDTGPATGYKNAYGVSSIVGSHTGIGVSSRPLSYTTTPKKVDVVITYYSDGGQVRDYKISLRCTRSYPVYDRTIDMNNMYLFNETLYETTRENLNRISGLLTAIKEEGEKIKKNQTKLDDVDINRLANISKKSVEEYHYLKLVSNERHKSYSRKFSTKMALMVVGIVFGFVAFILILAAIFGVI